MIDPARSTIGAAKANEQIINVYSSGPCQGITLGELRQRLRNELSSYAPDSLIPSTGENDVERQFINDGILKLWPHDYQVVMVSIRSADTSRYRYRYIMPEDCEHVFSVFRANKDINNQDGYLDPLPHHSAWIYEQAFINATLSNLEDGEPWVDATQKVVNINGAWHMNWIVARYARQWPQLFNDLDCIEPSPTRIQAIVFYACAQYFWSQLQVNTESIRYRNYQTLAQQFQALAQQNLTLDSKPLWIS